MCEVGREIEVGAHFFHFVVFSRTALKRACLLPHQQMSPSQDNGSIVTEVRLEFLLCTDYDGVIHHRARVLKTTMPSLTQLSYARCSLFFIVALVVQSPVPLE